MTLSTVPDACWHADASASCVPSFVSSASRTRHVRRRRSELSRNVLFTRFQGATAAPTNPECHDLNCWDTDVAPWNCDQKDGPAALVKTTDGDYTHWSIARHDDEWENAEDLPNAVSYDATGLLEGDDGFYAVAAVNQSLCRVDEDHVECFSGLLRTKPTAGTVFSTKYYYSSSTTLYHVSQIHTDTPTFASGIRAALRSRRLVAVDEALHGGAIVGDSRSPRLTSLVFQRRWR